MATQQTTTEQNKSLVRDFYTLAFIDKEPREAARKYLGTTYVQHNPMAADGPDAFVQFAEGYFGAVPGLKVEIKRMLVDGNLVAVHSQFVPQENARGTAVMDIFRVENGKIVEHWDVLQEVPEKSANRNTMF